MDVDTVQRFASGFTTLGLATAEPIQGPEKVSGKLIGARERSVFRICSAPGKRPLSYMSIRQRTDVHFSRKLIRRLKRFRFLRPLRENPYSVAFFPAKGLAARGKSRSGAKNGDCHQFAPRHDPRNKHLA